MSKKWIVMLALAAITRAANAQGVWQSLPGYNVLCFWSPSAREGDCIVSQAIQLEQVKPDQIHIIDKYPVAYSQQTGMQWNGHLSLMILVKGDTVQVIEDSQWRREDGFTLRVHDNYKANLDGTIISKSERVE